MVGLSVGIGWLILVLHELDWTSSGKPEATIEPVNMNSMKGVTISNTSSRRVSKGVDAVPMEFSARQGFEEMDQ